MRTYILLKQMNIISFFKRVFFRNRYIFDNGEVLDMKKINKGNITYKVIKLNTDINSLVLNIQVFLNIKYEEKYITYQLMKSFSSESKSNQYFKELSNFVKINDNNDILLKCYKY